MSETREVYNVAMQPGRLLDAQVAQVMGRLSDKVLAELKQRGAGVLDEQDMYGRYVGYSPWENVLCYSTDPAAAMQAWEWLERNLGPRYNLAFLVRADKPSVCLCWHAYEPEMIIEGDTYPHAIALAVVERGRALGVIE